MDETELMWLHTNLCYYDLRNPHGIKESSNNEELKEYGNYTQCNCYCDNCFHGKSTLAEYIINLNNKPIL